jgi:hypothetical protein
MLEDSNLGRGAEAMSTVSDLQIRRSMTVRKRMTPQEVCTGHKPSIDHLRGFGCELGPIFPGNICTEYLLASVSLLLT